VHSGGFSAAYSRVDILSTALAGLRGVLRLLLPSAVPAFALAVLDRIDHRPARRMQRVG
jgi:hypothetical protein